MVLKTEKSGFTSEDTWLWKHHKSGFWRNMASKTEQYGFENISIWSHFWRHGLGNITNLVSLLKKYGSLKTEQYSYENREIWSHFLRNTYGSLKTSQSLTRIVLIQWQYTGNYCQKEIVESQSFVCPIFYNWWKPILELRFFSVDLLFNLCA